MGEREISEFLSHLAVKEHVAASTQNQALNAIVFLYKHVLKKDIGELKNIHWAKRPSRLPVVLTHVEVRRILEKLRGKPCLMVSILYGTGIRLQECLHLRVKDIDFGYHQIIVRDGNCALPSYSSGCTRNWNHEKSHQSYVSAFICDASSGKRLRYSYSPATPWS